MPPKRVTRPLQRQLSLETPGMTSDPGLDSDDNGFNPVKAATELQKSIEGVSSEQDQIHFAHC